MDRIKTNGRQAKRTFSRLVSESRRMVKTRLGQAKWLYSERPVLYSAFVAGAGFLAGVLLARRKKQCRPE